MHCKLTVDHNFLEIILWVVINVKVNVIFITVHFFCYSNTELQQHCSERHVAAEFLNVLFVFLTWHHKQKSIFILLILDFFGNLGEATVWMNPLTIYSIWGGRVCLLEALVEVAKAKLFFSLLFVVEVMIDYGLSILYAFHVAESACFSIQCLFVLLQCGFGFWFSCRDPRSRPVWSWLWELRL